MHILVGLHAVLGEIGALAFLWVFVDLLNPNETRIKRACRVALIGVILLFLAWFAGGYYYLTQYGSVVKPVIKAGPTPWAHDIFTETKEHIFLFIPFLAVLAYGLLERYRDAIHENRNIAVAIVILSGLIVAMAFAMAGMGFIISSGFRSALESKIL